MAKETLLLQPIRGKYCQSNINGKTVRVWLVDPDTNKQGTEIPYLDAISILALPHPVVCMAQIKDKDGKYCNVLDDEDKKAIEAKKHEYMFGKDTSSPSNSSNEDVLKKLVETQSQLIENQNKQIEDMQNKFSEMEKNIDKLLKKSKKQS